MLVEPRLMRAARSSYLIGVLSYVVIVFLAYNAIGWGSFPYRQYYPHYLSPYWWEFFVVPIWEAVIGFVYAVPCHLLGKVLGGEGTWTQVLTFVLLASIVSLPIFLLVDACRVICYPEVVVEFAKNGPDGATADLYRATPFARCSARSRRVLAPPGPLWHEGGRGRPRLREGEGSCWR